MTGNMSDADFKLCFRLSCPSFTYLPHMLPQRLHRLPLNEENEEIMKGQRYELDWTRKEDDEGLLM